MGTFKNVFNVLIVQILCSGMTLHLTKDMNAHMVDSHFQVKGESCHFAEKNTHPDLFFKGATLPQNSHLRISLPLFRKYEM